MKKIEEQIYDCFAEQPIPQLDKSTDEKLKALVIKNKKPSKIKFWKRFSIFATASLCLLICLILPFIIPPHSPSNDKFYTDIEATKTPMQQEAFNLFITNQYPQYNFLTTDFDFESSCGFYIPNTDSLLAVFFAGYEKDDPFTGVKIYITLNNQFKLTNLNYYTDDAQLIETEKYILYKKTENGMYGENLLCYVKFEKHQLFIRFDWVNEQLLEKFL